MVSTKIASSKATRRKRIKSKLRKMGKIAASQGGETRNSPLGNHAPITLGRRLILRSRIPLDIELFAAFHQLYKEDSIRATNVLIGSCVEDGEPTLKFNVALRCAIQELWEDRLKTSAQLLGLLPPDPELTRPTQELFEQFWEAHGYPNEAEMDLLERVGRVDAAIVDAWCMYEPIYESDLMLTSQQSLAERLSASNIQVAARSNEGYHGEHFAGPEKMEAHCEAGAQSEEAIYSPLGRAESLTSQSKHIEATSTRKKLRLHRSLESQSVQDRVNANPDDRIYCNLAKLNMARCNPKQKHCALSVFSLCKTTKMVSI